MTHRKVVKLTLFFLYNCFFLIKPNYTKFSLTQALFCGNLIEELLNF